MNNEKELVSIVIPVKNERDRIRTLIDGFHKQTYRPIEVIFVDGGSTDGTVEEILNVVKKYFDRGFAVRLLTEKSFGLIRSPANARNIGALTSRGKYVVFFDADFDLTDKSAVGKIVAGLDQKDHVAISYIPNIHTWIEKNLALDDIIYYFHGGKPLHILCGFRREIFDRATFDPNLGFREDFEFLQRIGTKYGIVETELFMNDDVILEPDCIRKLVNALSHFQNLAAVQPLIVDKDGSLNYGLDLGLSGFGRVIRHPRNHPLSEAFCVSGAALLTRKEAFLRAGEFDDSLFFCHDDVDYSWRLRLMGYDVACVANARAYHWGSATLGPDSPQSLYFITRNSMLVVAKNSSLMWFLPRLFLVVIETSISFFGRMLLRRRNAKMALQILYALLEGLINLRISFNKRTYVAKIRRSKEREVNRAMNSLVDVEFIFSRTLRRALGLRW